MQPSEHQIQSAFFSWVRAAKKLMPVLGLMFAVPNAGKRTYKVAAMMKAEGMIAGVPDIMFPVARNGFNGLAIEFKVPGGKLSDEQAGYARGLVGENWLFCLLTDAEEAIRIVKNYLE